MVILDTNIIIDHLRGSAEESKLIKTIESFPGERMGVSVISIQELYEGRSTLNAEAEKNLLTTMTKMEVLPYTYEIASLAGKLARDLNRPIELADAAIAATAILNRATLLTLNKKDFSNIPGVELI